MPDITTIAADAWPVVVLRGSALQSLGISEMDVAALARDLVREIYKGDTPPLVQKLVVVDYAEYGTAIRAETGRDTGPTHTDRDDYKGVAITIPGGAQDALTHTVVVCAGAVAAALGHDDVEPIMPRLLGRYLLQHEFGHCHDHLVRGLPDCVNTPDASWLQQVNARFRQNLMTEFVACWMSGIALTDETLALLLRMDADPLEAEVQRILRFRDEYRTFQRQDLSEIAGEACQCVWLILIQCAKHVGHIIGAGKSSASVAMPQALTSRPDAMSAIIDLSRLLRASIDNYPDWPDAGWEELNVIWNALAVSLGFRFEETPSGPALWFD